MWGVRRLSHPSSPRTSSASFLAAAGEGTNAIAEALGTRPATVSRWRTRFAEALAGEPY